MAKAKFQTMSMSSLFSRHSNQKRTDADSIVKEGILAKMENNKPKYFVLRRGTSKDCPACLEYYENENKFKEGIQPKRRYLLKDFYVSRKAIERKDHAFGLFINSKKCKTLIASSAPDMEDWLTKLNTLKREISPIVEFDRIWIVTIMNRGLAPAQKLVGELFVCLDNWSIWLIVAEDDMREIPLNSIKNYGRTSEFFFLEVGRQATIGAGTVWMKTEDSYIAQNMLDIIKDALYRYENFPHEMSRQDNCEQGRPRVNSLTSSRHSGIVIRPRNRTFSDSFPSGLPGSIPSGTFYRNPNFPFDPLKMRSRINPFSARQMTSSEEENLDRSIYKRENEYVFCQNSSPNCISSPTSELQLDSGAGAYLEMGSSASSTRNASTPIPIVKKTVDSLQQDTSPQSGNSSATSATTSSDQMQELEGMSGSESLVGSCFGATELLDRPIRTSSVGSKTEQYKRKNSAPMLAWSPSSHSWSGTSGTYFRNVAGINQTREKDTMMIDYSNPNISQEEKGKKGFFSSLSGHRLRSNSKSSRSSNVKLCDSDTKSIDFAGKKASDDYYEIDYQSRDAGQMYKGYLPMSAPKARSGDSLERKKRLEQNYLEMSPKTESANDGYVDMTQSSSSLSISKTKPTPSPPQVNLNPAQRESIPNEPPPEKIQKKVNKKATKSKSMKESCKKSKSDSDKCAQDSSESVTKAKGTFSFLAGMGLIRKTSTSKTPVNIQPVQPRTPSPISILTRRRSRDPIDESENFPASLPLTSHFTRLHEKQQEKMLFVPHDDYLQSQLKKISETCATDGYTRTECYTRHSLTETSARESRNYVNLTLNPSPSSPLISQQGRQSDLAEVPSRQSSTVTSKNGGYLLMSSTIIKPDDKEHHSKSDNRLQAESNNCPGERSRSVSGPVAKIDGSGAKDEKNPAERTASATSSPTSRSPPVTPGLGSVSSMSSLSEGGLSSASSTCTVINFGAARSKCPSGGTSQAESSQPLAPQDSEKSKPASLNMNYASLDLTKNSEGSPRPSRSRHESRDSNYCEIDFTKSESLMLITKEREKEREKSPSNVQCE